MAKKLTFRRSLRDARPFEILALNIIGPSAFVGSYYPFDELENARLETQMTRPEVDIDIDALDVFYFLKNVAGQWEIEIALQVLGVFVYGGWIPAGGESEANLVINDEIVNGRHTLSSDIDGQSFRFVYDPGYGTYLPEEEAMRVKVIEGAEQRKIRPLHTN